MLDIPSPSGYQKQPAFSVRLVYADSQSTLSKQQLIALKYDMSRRPRI